MGDSDLRGAVGLLSLYLGPISILPAGLQIQRQTKAFYLIGWEHTKDSLGGWMGVRKKSAETERFLFLFFLFLPSFLSLDRKSVV